MAETLSSLLAPLMLVRAVVVALLSTAMKSPAVCLLSYGYVCIFARPVPGWVASPFASLPLFNRANQQAAPSCPPRTASAPACVLRSIMDRGKKIDSVSFMFDRDRDSKPESVSAATRISGSEKLRTRGGRAAASSGTSRLPDRESFQKIS